MSRKPDMSKWPHNGRPSSRHEWKEQGFTKQGNGYISHCQRCGCRFHSVADTRAPIYCYPSREWMAVHPDDNGWLGESKTAFG